MELSTISTYFSRTALDGYDGAEWHSCIGYGSFMPHDRFISEREFGLKRRYLLVHPDNPLPSTYSVIRLAGASPAYMVGVMNEDVYDDVYSLIYLTHRAPFVASVVTLQKTTKASGVGATITRSVTGTYFGDFERVSFERATEVEGVRFTAPNVILPSDAVVDTDNEIDIDGQTMLVEETYMSAGLRYCRCVAKR